MARLGYMEARERLDLTREWLKDAERQLAAVDADYPDNPEMRELIRRDRLDRLVKTQALVDAAVKAFEPFKKPLVKKRAELYPMEFRTALSTSVEMALRINREREKEQITLSELLRRAVAVYFEKQDAERA